jgi:hypothetical protein
VRCGRCGNENAGTNRFCGMCGAPLVPKAQGGTPSAVQAGVPAQNIAASRAAAGPAQSLPMQPVGRAAPPAPSAGQAGSAAPVEPRPVTLSSFEVARDDEPDPEPIISGPSFLGLNKPAARRGGFHPDRGREQLRSSGNVDYLLDDEEPRRGWGKLIFVVVALALAGGFGYLRYKQVGFDWLKAGLKKPATQASDAGQNGTGTDNGGQAGTVAAPESAGPPGGAAATAPAGGGTTASGATPTPATSQPASSTASPTAASTPPTPVQDDSPSQSNSPAQSKPGDASAASPAAANSDSDSDSSGEEQPAVTKATAPKPAATRPTAAKPSPAKPADTVAEAQRYVYGNGVHQDCDRGLRILKTAAGQSDAKAMISLGALYSTGTCAPRDLPTAYRWFALALHKQPDNLPLQGDLQKLWSQMTPPERQLAIKLSQ